MFQITEIPKDMERGFRLGFLQGHKTTGDERVEYTFDFPGIGLLTKEFPLKFSGDTDEKRELEALYGKSLRLVTDLGENQGIQVVAFVGVKRASGGRLTAYVGPLVPLQSFKKAAAEIGKEEAQLHSTK